MAGSAGIREIGRLLLCLILVVGLAACQTDLYKNLSERQANEMAATLAHHGIAAERHYQDDGTVTLTVAESQFADAVDVLRRAGLPDQQFTNLGQVFKDTGLVSSPAQQHARMIYALGQELAHTISDIDGVLTARVQVVLPNNDLLHKNAKPSSASVFIRYSDPFDVAKLTPRIKKLVANGVAGLDYNHVSVVAIKSATADNDQDRSQPVVINTSFLGLSIAQSSLGAARWLFGILIVVILAMGGVIAWLIWKERQEREPYSLTPSKTRSDS